MPGSWSKKRIFFTFLDLQHNQRQSPTHSLLAFFCPADQKSRRLWVGDWISGRNNATWFSLYFCHCTMCSLVEKIRFKLFETLIWFLLLGKLNRLIWSSPCGIFFFQLYVIGTLPLIAIYMCVFITNLAFSFSIQYPLSQWIKRSFLATTNSTSGILFSPQFRLKEQLLDAKLPGVLCITTLIHFKDWRLIQQTFIDNSPRNSDRHELGLNTRKKIEV